MQIDHGDKPIWERLDQEPSAWFARYLIFRHIKPAKRELLQAARIYQAEASKGPHKPYKDVPGAWKLQADKWNWRLRAEAYDAHLQAEQEAREAAYREFEAAEKERLLSTGLALVEKRVEALSDLFELVKKSWLDAEGKEIVYPWVTPDKIREARGCLDDIAKELGQRAKKDKLEHSGSIEFATEWGGGRLGDDSEE